MSKSKALAEKEKGNAAFKAADYPTAVGHYSAAIVADRNDFTFPLNRAAAYLKLGKYEDAERDCTTVLGLSAMNAKALFRRGQARVALGKLNGASTDLNQASKREPTNSAITEEIKKVEALIEKRKQKAPVKPISVPSAPSPSSATPKRRRVPIQIIESSPAPSKTGSSKKPAESAPKSEIQSSSKPAQSQSSEDTFKAVSTRTLDKSSTTSPKPSSANATSSTKETQNPVAPAPPPESPSPPPATPPSTVPASPQPDQARTFKDAKAARENARPSRVGGGIFRASGQNTIFPTREMTPPGPTPPPKKEPKAKPSPDPNAAAEGSKPTAFPISPSGSGRPLTLFDFARSWESKPGLEDRWALLTAIPPSKIPSVFQTSLEPSLLVSILALFKEVLSATGASSTQGTRIEEYMKSFGEVKRFETVVLFMSKTEKQLAVEIWDQLGVDRGDAGNAWGKIWA